MVKCDIIRVGANLKQRTLIGGYTDRATATRIAGFMNREMYQHYEHSTFPLVGFFVKPCIHESSDARNHDPFYDGEYSFDEVTKEQLRKEMWNS